MAERRKTLYLIDGSSYIFRAYYAIQPLSNSKGLPTNALYGFTRMILKFLKDENPEKLAIVFDTEEPTFRDEMYKEYKANRKAPPDDLVPQFAYFGPIVEALNIKKLSRPGFEADDVIATVAKKAVLRGYDVVIITGDKDFMQLVGDNIRLYDTMKERWTGEAEVKERFGVGPDKVVDIMSLIGDTSDNIPGVSGIGGKTAVSLIKQYGGLDSLLSNIDKISNARAKAALKDGRENALLSRALAKIKDDVPLEFDWGEFDVGEPDVSKVSKVFSELEFFRLLREFIPSDEQKSENYTVVSDGLDGLSNRLKSEKSVGLYFLEGSPFLGVGIACASGGAFYIPLAHQTLEEAANIGIPPLKGLFTALAGKKIYLYGSKGVLKGLGRYGITLGNIDDVQLMAYVLNPAYPSDIKTLAQQVLGEHDMAGNDVSAKGGKKAAPKTVHQAKLESCSSAEVLLRLAAAFESELARNESLGKLYRGLELPLVRVLMKMEEKGVFVDVSRLEALSKEYGKKISAIEEKIYKIAGEKFAINSPKQLAGILFEKLKIPAAKKTKTGYSTDSSVLTRLASSHELPALIIEYRTHAKLKSTYIDVLPSLVDKETGRIHTTFNQTVTATGRLSSSDPNLQNVPARSEEGMRIRAAFVAGPGHKLLSADYSQIELRILAHISSEAALIDAFENGVDVHASTAARIFGISPDKVDSRMRGVAKTVNFGVLYGQSAYGLSEQLGIDARDADAYIKNYYDSYPEVKRLKEKILKDAEENGYVETICGRRRYIPDIMSPNKGVKAFAERTAFNAVFQGTAADIIKMAMLGIDAALEKGFEGVSMLLQVHDELVFEVPVSKIEPLSALVRRVMCGAARLNVPLAVDISTGSNWAEC